MNWDRIEGNWKQLTGKIKEQWGRLTDDSLDIIAGKRDQLAGKLQESYGITKDEAERQRLWSGRKNAFGAVGRISPSYYVQDGVIPRTKIPQTLAYIEQVSKKYGLQIGNMFHAGDGNLHPLILFDNRSAEQTQKTIAAGREILEYCVSVGGSITGEHGVGMEKMEMMLTKVPAPSPPARIAVISLSEASLLKPIRMPTSTAIGNV